jgi:hypothetical protein
MTRHTQEPTATVTDRGTRFDHPAFGQIVVSKISGHTTLYGSDFQHDQFVQIRVYKSQLNRDLSRDWHYPYEEFVSVNMSEAQWATFVSSFGVGGGVPCTIEHINRERMPGIPYRDEAQSYKIEAHKTVKRSVQELKDLRAEVAEGVSGLSKVRQETILKRIDRSISSLNSSLPFVVDSFSEHMETRVEKAKVEINAYMTNTVMRAGLDTLGLSMPLQLEPPRD